MANILKILRSLTAAARPAGSVYGAPYVNFADKQFGVVDSGGTAQDLIGVPFFSTGATYAAGNAVNYQGRIYIATGAVTPGAFNAAQWSSVVSQSSVTPHSGLLYRASASQLNFRPFYGDQIKIDGVLYQIPAGEITTGATGCYLNGVAGSNLTAGNDYYVYLFNNAGTPTIDFSLTGYAGSTSAGNVGVFTKIGDQTRTLIGFVRCSSSPNFFWDDQQFRWVRSAFNGRTQLLQTANAFAAQKVVASPTAAEIGSEIRLNFLSWSGDTITAHFIGFAQNNTAGKFGYVSIALDTNANPVGTVYPYTGVLGGTSWQPMNVSESFSTQSPGAHYITVYGWCETGSSLLLGLTSFGMFNTLTASIQSRY